MELGRKGGAFRLEECREVRDEPRDAWTWLLHEPFVVKAMLCFPRLAEQMLKEVEQRLKRIRRMPSKEDQR